MRDLVFVETALEQIAGELEKSNRPSIIFANKLKFYISDNISDKSEFGQWVCTTDFGEDVNLPLAGIGTSPHAAMLDFDKKFRGGK